MRRCLLVLPLLLAVAGCGEAATNSAEDFRGPERAVAEVVEDLQSAAEARDADRICSDILADALVDRLRSAGSSCREEMEWAIKDANDFELRVRDVAVTGNTARATVERGAEGDQGTQVLEFTRVGGRWRATSLSGG